MWIRVDKADLKITQIYHNYVDDVDLENFHFFEQDISLLDLNYIKAIDTDGIISIIEDTEAKIAADKASRIHAREVLADADIAAQRISTYGFQSETACIRVAMQWQAMATNPGSWTSDQLPTESDVLAYANAMLLTSETFAKYCITRWNQYLAEKAVIEAE